MSTSPLVSVVIPTYNRPQQTIAAIESVLAQTYPRLEIIVVDDGSADASHEVIRRFITQKADGPHRIALMKQPNGGASAARNTGIAESQGDYIAFLDSDDLWVPSKLDSQIRALDQFRSEPGACVADTRLVNDSGLDISSSFRLHGRRYEQATGIEPDASRLIAESFCGFWLSALLVRADLIRRIGGFDSEILFMEDRDIHFRLSLITPIAYVNKPLVQSDRTPSPPGSTCRPWDKPAMQFREHQRMLEKWLAAPLPPDVRSIVKRAVGTLHSHQANWHLENARYSEAREAAYKAVKYKRTPGTIAKFMLTWMAPALARRIVPHTRPVGSEGHAS